MAGDGWKLVMARGVIVRWLLIAGGGAEEVRRTAADEELLPLSLLASPLSHTLSRMLTHTHTFFLSLYASLFEQS